MALNNIIHYLGGYLKMENSLAETKYTTSFKNNIFNVNYWDFFEVGKAGPFSRDIVSCDTIFDDMSQETEEFG